MDRFRDLLFKNRNFSLFWLGQVISNFGDRLTQMALIAYVYQRSPGSTMALAKLFSFTLIPVFLIGPVAGVWVDRWDRKSVMIVSDILRGFLILLIPLFIMLKQAILIYMTIFLVYSVTRFFIPSRMAIIPDLVSKDKLLAANSLANTTRVIGNAIGLVVAGLLVNIRHIGAIGGFYIDSATFFISAVTIGMIVPRELLDRVRSDLTSGRSVFEGSIRRSIVAEIKDGIRYLATNRSTRLVVGMFFLFMAGIGAFYCVMVVFIQESFGSVTRDLAFFGMFLMTGLFLGTVIFGRFGHLIARQKAITISMMATGLSIILFVVVVRQYHNHLLGLCAAFVVGYCASPIAVSSDTMIHEIIPQGARGRAFSSLEAVGNLAFMIFMFAASYLSKYFGRGLILIVSGTGFVVCGMVGLFFEMRTKRAAI